MVTEEEVTSPVNILAKLQPLEFKEINVEDLPEGLPPFSISN